MIENKYPIYNRFHITNLSELSKKIRDLGMAQFASLYLLEKGAYDSKLTDIFTVSLWKCNIIMTLASIKYANGGIKEYYYNWEITDMIIEDKIYLTKNNNL
jgi:hypothetical protein